MLNSINTWFLKFQSISLPKAYPVSSFVHSGQCLHPPPEDPAPTHTQGELPDPGEGAQLHQAPLCLREKLPFPREGHSGIQCIWIVFWLRKDELFSQSMLQHDMVLVLSRNLTDPITHLAVEFNMEVQERALSGGKKKWNVNATIISMRRQNVMMVKKKNVSALELFLFKHSISYFVNDLNRLT